MSKSSDFLSFVQEAKGGEDFLRHLLETAMQQFMHHDVQEYVGAERHERNAERKGYRNGYKPRGFRTRVGELHLSVPQVRDMEPYTPPFWARWERVEGAVLMACAEMYFMGISTRKVKDVLETMGGYELSASAVSQAARALDEQLQAFRGRRLDGSVWRYLVVDAAYFKVRDGKHVVSRAALVVAGINGEGHREVLTWRMADVESGETWGEVFQELRQRGLSGVECVVSDGHEGIQAAVRRYFDGASWQRCWAHFIRSAMAKVNHSDKDALGKELSGARKFEEVRICLAEAERIASGWEARYPRLSSQIRAQFIETLSVHGLVSEHRRRLYTSNMLERTIRELKRRTDVVGIFPNAASCDRLIGAQLLDMHERWLCSGRVYLNMNHLDRRAAQ